MTAFLRLFAALVLLVLAPPARAEASRSPAPAPPPPWSPTPTASTPACRSRSACGCVWRRAGTPTGAIPAMPGSPRSCNSPCPTAPAPDPIAWPAPQRQPEGPLMTYGYSGDVLLAAAGQRPGQHGAAARELAGLQGHLRAGGGRFPPRPAHRHARRLARGAAVRRRRGRPAAPLALVRAGGGGRHADRHRRRHLPRVGARGLVHSRRRRHGGRPGRADAAGGARAFHPRAEARRGVPGRCPACRRADACAMPAGSRPRWTSRRRRADPPAAPDLPLWRVIGFALLGGLILNLMPCVFPVLAVKAVGLAGLSGAAHRHAVAHALSYTAGVVATFLLVGAALLGPARRRATRLAGGFSSSRRPSSPAWPGCCSPSG